MKAIFPVIITMMILLAGCATSAQSSNPAWVDKLIQQFESDPVANPPLSIWRYDYNGQTVYFVPAQCCDIYSMVYNASGSLLCAPDGGITGEGDGKCPDFFSSRTNEQLIWQDARSR
jgi:hypothetical protein